MSYFCEYTHKFLSLPVWCRDGDGVVADPLAQNLTYLATLICVCLYLSMYVCIRPASPDAQRHQTRTASATAPTRFLMTLKGSL
jgi:hypothetical protein